MFGWFFIGIFAINISNYRKGLNILLAHSSLTFHGLWQSLRALYDDNEAQAVVRMLLEERYGMSFTDIVCGGVGQLPDEDVADLMSAMRRLQCGEPVQYVLGHAYFYGRRFMVAPGVLIPRPETEQLCGIILENKENAGASGNGVQKVLDLCTGSGCIAITLALEMPDAEVSAVDISPDALLIAERNSNSLGACVSFCRQDILSVSADDVQGEFSLIVSNPPYITVSERQQMSRNVLEHEPHVALFVPDDDPLRFYRVIGELAVRKLARDGGLYFEINPVFAAELKNMLLDMGFSHVRIIDDYFGKQRFAMARL